MQTKTSPTIDNFRHPILTPEEMFNGTRLGIDSWADTSCAGKHAYVESFVEGKLVNASGFSTSLGSMKNLPIANVVYAYDMSDGQTLLIENHNAIYLGDNMNDSLINPIQAEENNVHIDIRPRRFYPSETNQCQSITFSDGTILPIKYDGVLPYLPIRRPTPNELDTCTRISITPEHDWDPYSYEGFVSTMKRDANHLHKQDDMDPISMDLHSAFLKPMLLSTPMLKYFNNTYVSISAINSRRTNTVSAEELSRKWNIGLKTASRTLQATTHKCIRTTGLLSKRFKTDKAQLRYKQLSRQYGTFYVDYLKISAKSLRGFIGGTIYTNKLGFKKFFPCTNETGESTAAGLRTFIDIVGLPTSIHSDNHSNFQEGAFKRLMRKFGIPQTFTEPHSPWQNRAEAAIGETKTYARRLMQKTNTPIRLWCFCFEYTADILSLCATGRHDLKGRTSYEAIMNYTPDISEYVSFDWFQWCWYYNEETKSKSLCRWLGPAHNIGQSFCSYILLENASFITRSSILIIQDDEIITERIKSMCDKFMQSIESKIGNQKQPIFDEMKPTQIYHDVLQTDASEDDIALPYGDEIIDAIPTEINEKYLDSLDNYIGTNVVIPGTSEGIEPVIAVIKGRKRDHNGNPIGISNPNPILDTRIYQLEFPDGRVEEYGMNLIVENLLTQVDEQGWDTGIFNEIIDVRKDELIAIPIGPTSTISLNGRDKPIVTTKGWDILIKWKDGSTNWIPLSTAKQSYPIQIAEYAIASKIDNEPAFKWWVRHTLKKRDRIISKTASSRPHRKGKMKFGIRVPTTVEEAMQLDHKNGNTLWHDAIEKEMKNSRIAFELLNKDDKPPPGYKKITCHMNFEVKMDLRRKARYVAGGHLTDPPSSMTYSTVVSRESVRIAFLVAALNGLNVLAGDIQNAYLNAPTTEKLFFYAGDEWKADKGRPVLIVRALYGLKSSALAWRNHLADVLSNKLGFKSSLADPDVWYKPAIDKNGHKYYTYILVYVDDILVIDECPMKYMTMLRDSYTVREDTIKEPDQYLGADIGKVTFNDGTHAWTMGSASYIKNAVKNVKARLKEDGFQYNSKLSSMEYSARQPFSSVDYRPELDTSLECNDEQINFYQNLIGVLRWIVELGRIDIAFECAVLSQYLAFPRTGHLNQALHIFKYLDIHNESELTFDPNEYFMSAELIEESKLKLRSMSQLYADAKEELPPNAPEARGKPVQINCFVDSDHAGDRTTRRSHTGIIIYLNTAPISWYSKKQTTVESSTFGSEFVALRLSSEQIISLRYKLRMFGIPIQGPANIFCDNESVFKNASYAESRLKKKHNSVCFHRVRECVASAILMPFKVGTDFNLADILTKSLPAIKRLALRRMIMPTHK